MSELEKKCEKIIQELEDGVKDKEELKFIKDKVCEITKTFQEELTKQNEKLDILIGAAVIVDKRIAATEEFAKKVEKDIYEDCEDDEFEVTCPYCNCDFFVYYEDFKEEIKCPECGNLVELEFSSNLNKEEGCGHGGCSGHCCSGEHKHCEEENDEDK